MEDYYTKIAYLRDSDQLADVYELVIEDHVQYIDPKNYKLTNALEICPKEFYVTSGDAVEKTKALLREYKSIISQLTAKATSSKLADYVADLILQQSAAEEMLALLIKARGTSIFLETEWNQHHLLCIPKNPRAK